MVVLITQRSVVQIHLCNQKNLLPSISSVNPATIRIDNFEFQFNTSERTADDKYDRNSFRMAPSFGQSQYVTPTFAVLFLAEQPGEQSDVHEKCKEELVASVQ